VGQLPYEDATIARNADQVLAIIGETQSSHQFRMAIHGSHAFTGIVIIDGQCFIRAAGGYVETAAIQAELQTNT
jgi:hypothetical protein